MLYRCQWQEIHGCSRAATGCFGIAVRGEGDVTTLELTDSYNAEVRRGDRIT